MEELERLLKMYSRKFLGFLLTTYFLIQIVTASETSVFEDEDGRTSGLTEMHSRARTRTTRGTFRIHPVAD
ncbi:hypothetical protein RR46_14955 [Papilio xuthus]|uniref:Uncharacterized protein n=1 Tax=Papilio xuthus TaxID=66420 RepID=A0A194PDM6_PAPXU|nr:hypothetical protein RR46_14955 [Papilio xuthus]